MIRQPLTIPNLIQEVSRLGGNVITTGNQYTIMVSTLRSDVDLICGIKQDDSEYAVIELWDGDDIDKLVDFLFSKSVEHHDDGSTSGLSEDGIKVILHSIIPQGYYI